MAQGRGGADGRVAGDAAVLGQCHPEALGCSDQPGAQERNGGAGLMAAADGHDCGMVLGTAVGEVVEGCGVGKEGVADAGALAEIEEIGAVAPELAARGALELVAELAQCGGAQAAIANRILRAQLHRDHGPHDVEDDEPLRAPPDEGQGTESGEDVLGFRLGQHRGKQRAGHAAHDAGRLERLSRFSVEAVEEQPGELLGRKAEHGVAGPAHVRRRRGDKLQRKRVAAQDSVGFRRTLGRHPESA
jgi:hypothetical protein